MKGKSLIAGILSIVSGACGVLGFLAFIVSSLAMFYLMFQPSTRGTLPSPITPFPREFIAFIIVYYIGMDPVMKLLIIIGIVMMVIGSLGIAGGVLAIKKRSWPIALAGAIAGLITFYQIGIAAIVFTVMAKDEFTSKKGVNHFNQPAISPPVIS